MSFSLPSHRLLHRLCKKHVALVATALVGSLVLTGCGDDTDSENDSNTQPNIELTVGARLNSPGLISGTDPQGVSGLEVSITEAVAVEQGLAKSPANIAWLNADTTKEMNEDVGFLVGHISDLHDDVSWAGPYLMASAAIMTSTESDDTVTAVASLDDLSEASVCVVSASVAAHAQFPVGSRQVENTYYECALGLSSGRFNAIVGENIGLAGILTTQDFGTGYQILDFQELKNNSSTSAKDELVVDPQLTAPIPYWIGTPADSCESTSKAVSRLIGDGTIKDAVNKWAGSGFTDVQLPTSAQITTKNC